MASGIFDVEGVLDIQIDHQRCERVTFLSLHSSLLPPRSLSLAFCTKIGQKTLAPVERPTELSTQIGGLHLTKRTELNKRTAQTELNTLEFNMILEP